MKKTSEKVRFLICVFLVLFSLYSYFQNNFLVTSYHQITSEKLPEEFDGFRVVQISDFHNTKSAFLQNDIISETEKAQPDIIVITGDFIDSRRTDTIIALGLAKSLLEIAPVYMCVGNHEAAAYEKYPTLEKALKDAGVTVLRNETAVIQKENSRINITGIDDPLFFSEDNNAEAVKNELKRQESDKSLFTITLSHRPELFEVYAECEQDLVLSGHAHGGQFRIPFIGGLFSPTEGIFPKYSEGLHKEGSTVMVVSRGIGNSLFPVRLNNRPELIILTLHAE